MPDITMCKGGECPLKDTCYRHTAKPYSVGQSWFEPPYDKDDVVPCLSYLEDEDEAKTLRHNISLTTDGKAQRPFDSYKSSKG